MNMRKRRLRGATLVLALGAALSAAAEPAGDETFAGSFRCGAPVPTADGGALVCQSDINPGLPPLSLTLTWHEDAASRERLLDRIDIRRADEVAPFQTIAGIDSRLASDVAHAGFEALDLNFDGFLDIRVRRFTPAGPNIPFRNWLWSKEDGLFVASPSLDEITSPEFDAEAQEVVSRWRSSAAEHGTDVYSYEGATPVLVHRESDRLGAGGACERTFHDRIDDVLKKTGTGACEAN